MNPVILVGCMCFMAASPGAGAQQAQGHGGYRGPSTEQPVLTPAQKARLAQTDALQTAIVKNDGDAVRRLVAGGMSVDLNFDEAYRGRSSESPLTMAIGRGQLDIARLLLDSGADPNRRDGFGKLPVHMAGSVEAVALLQRYGADVSAASRNALAGPSPTQAVWNVIEKGDDAEVVKLLIEKGADPSAISARQTLLEHALFRKRWAIARGDVGGVGRSDEGAAVRP